MKAWQFTNTHEPLVLAEVAEPTPGPGEVLLDVKAAGLCHSDVGLLEDEGWLRTLAKRPITIGHYLATGKLTPTLSEITFDEIPAGLERLTRGEVVGRLVAKIAA